MEKVTLEFPLSSTSRDTIWEMISTPGGLAAWMADDVTVNGDKYLFSWGDDEEREAEMTGKRIGTYVRFHWLDEEPKTYFELRIAYSAFTRTFTLVVTEEAVHDTADVLQALWSAHSDQILKLI